MAARSFLRALLGAYLDRDPATLRFSSIERGKPVLDDSGEAPTVRFNLSHSGPLGVCALSRTCAVGVDVQLPSRRTSTRADEPELLRAWTALEAERKRTGLGLGAAERSGRLNEPRPWLARFDLGGDGAGAVALALPPSRLSLGVWRSGGGCTFRLLDLF